MFNINPLATLVGMCHADRQKYESWKLTKSSGYEKSETCDETDLTDNVLLCLFTSTRGNATSNAQHLLTNC